MKGGRISTATRIGGESYHLSQTSLHPNNVGTIVEHIDRRGSTLSSKK